VGAALRLNFADDAVGVGGGAHVKLQEHCRSAARSNVANDSLPFGFQNVGDDDMVAGRREGERRGAADADARASDQNRSLLHDPLKA
jgi:hypothetical protein